jgi:predicted nicotinamide N-methyase
LVDFDLREKRILELGCGLGLAGIAAAKAGAFVTLSDYEHDALKFCRYNAMRNLSENIIDSIRFLYLDWRELPALEKFDMILAADVVYERRNFFPLIEVLQKLLEPNGIAIITEPGRTIGEHFLAMLREHGFELATSRHDVVLDGKKSEVIRAVVAKEGLGFGV